MNKKENKKNVLSNNISLKELIKVPEMPKLETVMNQLAQNSGKSKDELIDMRQEFEQENKRNGCPDDELEEAVLGDMECVLRKPFLEPLPDADEFIEDVEEHQSLFEEKYDNSKLKKCEQCDQEEVMQRIGRIENDLDVCEYDSEVNYLKTTEETQREANETKSKGLYFNGKLVTGYPTEINMFCQSLVSGELYLSHYKGSDGFGTLWYLKNEETTNKTRIVESKNSLASTNKTRDKDLLKMAQEKYGIDAQKHLNDAGDFINNNYAKFFPEQKANVPRSKKDAYLVGIAEYMDKKYRIVVHSLTCQIHIYNKTSGIYESYSEKEFSAFLTNEYNERFLADEVVKIMGTFSTLKDESENYVAFKNCLLNLETLETKEFTSDEFVIFQVPFKWNPGAKSKVFEEKLREILVDEQRFEQFLQMLGYCFVKNNPHHKMFFITGDGANGKTTLMSIIKVIFHDSVTAVGLHQFENEFGLQPLLGKRINILSDLPKMSIRDTGNIKAVTGEDLMTVNRKYKEPVSVVLGCKIIGTGNQLPQVNDDSYAFWRRVIHIELTNRFKDPKVKKLLLNNTEGIEWLIFESIKAYKRVEKNGWAMERSEEEIRRDYLRLSNPCLYAAEELFEKTNEPDDRINREEVVRMISEYLKRNELDVPKDNKPYYKAIRDMGGDDIYDRDEYNKTIRVFVFIKPKKILEEK